MAKISRAKVDFKYYKYVAQEIKRDPLILKYEMLNLIKEAEQEIKRLKNSCCPHCGKRINNGKTKTRK